MSDPGDRGAALTVTMVRCSTLLLRGAGVSLLTDPWFGRHLRGLPCLRRPGLRPAEIPPLDALVVSHMHPDHFDARAVQRLLPAPRAGFFPPGAFARLRHPPAPGWHELAPWRTARVGDVEILAVPARHTGPGPDEVNHVLRFPGFGAVFFGGDARFDADILAEVRRRCGAMRLALLPVGGTRIFGRRTVMGPDDAERAADLLEATTVVPIHEGGIWLSVPPVSLHPGRARHLLDRMQRRGQADRVAVLAEGESVTLE